MANNKKDQTNELIEYNDKFDEYLAILIASIVNFSSVTDISVANVTSIVDIKNKVLAVFGATSFIMTLLILIFDRVSFLHVRFNFQNVLDGKLEGFALLFLLCWWIVGVGILTKADGIAFRALNTYFSAWYALGMTAWTLNKWSSSKDILSMQELTRLSVTLPYWYGLLISSLITVGSAADTLVLLDKYSHTDIPSNDESLIYSSMTPTAAPTTSIVAFQPLAIFRHRGQYAIFVGAVAFPAALFAILAHYNLICCCEVKMGGFLELIMGLLLCIWMIVAVSILTADGSVASTIQGQGLVGVTSDWMPGNNLFVSLWVGLYSSVQICLSWKGAQARVKMASVISELRSGIGQEEESDDVKSNLDSEL